MSHNGLTLRFQVGTTPSVLVLSSEMGDKYNRTSIVLPDPGWWFKDLCM